MKKLLTNVFPSSRPVYKWWFWETLDIWGKFMYLFENLLPKMQSNELSISCILVLQSHCLNIGLTRARVSKIVIFAQTHWPTGVMSSKLLTLKLKYYKMSLFHVRHDSDPIIVFAATKKGTRAIGKTLETLWWQSFTMTGILMLLSRMETYDPRHKTL